MGNEKRRLEKLGLTKEQIDSVCDLNNKDMKPVKDDLQKAQDDLKVAQEKLTTAEEAVKKFDGVDLEKQNQQIKDLQDALKRRRKSMPLNWLRGILIVYLKRVYPV